MRNKSELAEQICNKLDIDYYDVYNENGGCVTHKFLKRVFEEVK